MNERARQPIVFPSKTQRAGIWTHRFAPPVGIWVQKLVICLLVCGRWFLVETPEIHTVAKTFCNSVCGGIFHNHSQFKFWGLCKAALNENSAFLEDLSEIPTPPLLFSALLYFDLEDCQKLETTGNWYSLYVFCRSGILPPLLYLEFFKFNLIKLSGSKLAFAADY